MLIAPLNWGLGHATRCLPVASAFAKTADAHLQALEIHWASDGQALGLLRAELPTDAVIHELPSYGIRYPTCSASVNMVLGGPKMGAAILMENKAVAALHKRFNYNFILSDNRFGCYVKDVPSAIMTHQVHLPIRNWFSRKLGTILNHRLLAKFDQVVVPDVAQQPRLAGKMSASHQKIPTNYIGPVSRFSQGTYTLPEEKIALAIVLSGPEPQRTKLEQLLLEQLPTLEVAGEIVLVRGRPSGAPTLHPALLEVISAQRIQLKIHDFMATEALEGVLAKAEIIVTRPGYTTVMDLSVLGRKAIYIPTPGQPEQEWLGKSLEMSKMGISVVQNNFVLAKAVKQYQKLNEAQRTTNEKGDTLLKKWVVAVLEGQ